MRKIKQITIKHNSNDQNKKFTAWRLFLSIKILIVLAVSIGIGALLYYQFHLKKHIVSRNEQSLFRKKVKLMYLSPRQVISTTKVSAITTNSLVKSNQFEITYNVLKNPILSKSQKLDNIINELVDLVKKQELPTQPLSITLIHVKSKTISGYQQHISRYPASVAKLFWMVILEEYSNERKIASSNKIETDLKDMILKSDNDASSRIIDVITNTQSSQNQLSDNQFKTWYKKRNQLNRFFEKAGYKNIDISHKPFPLVDLTMTEPQGTELQLQNNSNFNQVSTYHAARLMYEIFTNRAVSLESSQKMATLLKRDLHLSAWKNNPPPTEAFNPIENFMGESLSDKDIIFASKAGQTSTGRHEVAYVAATDGRMQYIIAVFGKDTQYSESNTIFPDISQLVFERMSNHIK
ncbi:hypothetical protein NIES4071_01230 [Calothrix sp. NIES-4071]|nr:hypothetical protein NIES4071_01230 [Calothrix sp. NIES-4071]BAZ54469.1 hypothetical protein NIES4105_01220 [Calothrix sp. NIES-4105]